MTQTQDLLEQRSSELVVQSARLVRLVRRGLTQPAATRVLSLLDELGPSGVTALAAADHCSQPTMTGLVRQLEDSGFVAREPNPADARSSLVALTGKGRRELASVRERHGRLVADRLRATGMYGEPQLTAAVALLRHVLEHPVDETTGGTTP